MAEFIPRPQHGEGDSRQNCEAGRNHDQAGLWCNVRCPEKAVPEPVNHVEKRVEVRKRLPEGRQGVNRVEDARKEGERHDDEVLKRRQLVELVGPDSRNQTQGAEYRAAEQRKRRQPQRRPHWIRLDELLAKAFWRTLIITRPGTRNAL